MPSGVPGVQERGLHIACADGISLGATLFSPNIPNGSVVTIHSALAAPRGFYTHFARFLSSHGHTVLTYDYRGIGDSCTPAMRGRDIRMVDWGVMDMEAVFAWVLNTLKPEKLFAVGHSAGGQLLGLARHSKELAGAVMVAAPSGYWKHYPMPDRVAVWALWYLMMPLATLAGDRVHARALRLAQVDVPTGVARQWADWGRTPGYLFDSAHELDTLQYATLAMPVLAYSFTDDRIAPKTAVEALLKHYPKCDIEHVHMSPEKAGQLHMGHFGFFRQALRDSIWMEVAVWLDRHG